MLTLYYRFTSSTLGVDAVSLIAILPESVTYQDLYNIHDTLRSIKGRVTLAWGSRQSHCSLVKLNMPSIANVVSSFCLQQPLSNWPPPFYLEGLMLLLPTGHDILSWSGAIHKMLMSHSSATHATFHLLFFFTVYSTASVLLVWKRLVQIQDVLPLFTLNNKLSLPHFSQWFKYCLSSIAKCIFTPANLHIKRATVEQNLDVLFNQCLYIFVRNAIFYVNQTGRGKQESFARIE